MKGGNAEMRCDALIVTRKVSLDLVIPGQYAGEFIGVFNGKFPFGQAVVGGNIFTPVRDFYFLPEDCQIRVSIVENEQEEFYRLLRQFCKMRGISLDNPFHFQ